MDANAERFAVNQRNWDALTHVERCPDGTWRAKDTATPYPRMFSLKATKS